MDQYHFWSIIPLTLGLFVAYISINYLFISTLGSPNERIAIFISLIVSILTILFGIYLLFSYKPPPIPHDIAIIGFPKSGKTTLITSLFGEIFSQKPYRTTITTGSRFFKRSYKMQIGDFPGEDSQEYAENMAPSLNNLDFFRWVSEANGMVFVIDVAHILQPHETRRNYAAEITKDFRSTWQNLLDYNFNSENPLRKRPVVLAFTKSDLFNLLNPTYIDSNGTVDDEISLFDTLMPIKNAENILPDADETTLILAKVAQLGFSDTIPPIQQIEPDRLAAGEHLCLNAFKSLIDYLRAEADQFNIVFVSSFGTVDQQSRLGFRDLIKYMLPV